MPAAQPQLLTASVTNSTTNRKCAVCNHNSDTLVAERASQGSDVGAKNSSKQNLHGPSRSIVTPNCMQRGHGFMFLSFGANFQHDAGLPLQGSVLPLGVRHTASSTVTLAPAVGSMMVG